MASSTGGSGNPDDRELDRLLARMRDGDVEAAHEVWRCLMIDLKAMARGFMGHERGSHTLQPTALVNEAYMRLLGPSNTTWENRAHFFGAAARAIRRILTDHARTKGALKRGGAADRVPLEEIEDTIRIDSDAPDFVRIDGALDKLAKLDGQKAKVVELRFFGGLTVEQTALALGVSPSTVARDWQFARLWLHRALSEEPA